MQEILTSGSIAFVLATVAKAGGRKQDSRFIALTGICQVAIPLLQLAEPLFATINELCIKATNVMMTINNFCSSVENSTLMQFIIEHIN